MGHSPHAHLCGVAHTSHCPPISVWVFRRGMAILIGHRGVAQLGSALRSGRRGRGFKSRHPDGESPGPVCHGDFGGVEQKKPPARAQGRERGRGGWQGTPSACGRLRCPRAAAGPGRASSRHAEPKARGADGERAGRRPRVQRAAGEASHHPRVQRAAGEAGRRPRVQRAAGEAGRRPRVQKRVTSTAR